ncbi:hypothetical protein V2J09_016186 [Rumex salicifolius]
MKKIERSFNNANKNKQILKPRKNSRPKRGSIDIYAAQCDRCLKWRIVDSQEAYEEIRSKIKEQPFFCDKKHMLSCDVPADIEYDNSRVWVVDKPNIPETPVGFKRELILRRNFSRLDAFYVTPTGKRVRSSVEAASFLQDHPDEYKHVNPKDFNFAVPKVMEDTLPKT